MKQDDLLYTALGDLFNEILQDREDRQQIIHQVLKEGEKDGNEKAQKYHQRVMDSIDIRGFRSGVKKPLNLVVNKLAQETKRNPPVLVDLIFTWREIQLDLWEAVSVFLLESHLMEKGFPFPETGENYQLCETIATSFAEHKDALDYDFFEIMLMTVLVLLKGEDELKKEQNEQQQAEVDKMVEDTGEKEVVDGEQIPEEIIDEKSTTVHDREAGILEEQEITADKWEEILERVEDWSPDDPVWDRVNSFLSSIQEISRRKDECIQNIYQQMDAAISGLINGEGELISFFLFSDLHIWQPDMISRQHVEGVQDTLNSFVENIKKYKVLHERKPTNVTERRELSQEKDHLEELINPLYETIRDSMQQGQQIHTRNGGRTEETVVGDLDGDAEERVENIGDQDTGVPKAEKKPLLGAFQKIEDERKEE